MTPDNDVNDDYGIRRGRIMLYDTQDRYRYGVFDGRLLTGIEIDFT